MSHEPWGGKLILPPWFKDQPRDMVQLRIPRECLLSLFDFLSHMETGEFERKLELWSDMDPETIKRAGEWLDRLYTFLYDQGLRPRSFKRRHIPLLRKVVGRILDPHDRSRPLGY